MIRVKLIKLLIIVYIRNSTVNATLTVPGTLEKLSKKCIKINDDFFNNIAKTSKTLGAGSFGIVYEYSNNTAWKIITLKKDMRKGDVYFAKAIDDLMIEIDFMTFYASKKRQFNNLKIDLSYNRDSFYILQLFKCYYTIDQLKNNQPVIRIGLQLEKLDYSLERFLINNPDLDVLHLLDITKKIIRGLYQLHQYGYVHLDLKPDNIMMRNPFEPVLIDFGLVYRLKLSDTPHSIETIKEFRKELDILQGTPGYLDPNFFTKPKMISFYTDVYSLGVMIFKYFKPKMNYFANVNGKSPQPKYKLEDLVFPKVCEPYYKSCPFSDNDLHRAKYFRSLIYWLTRDNLVNRLYLDYAFEMISEIEQQYYNDCIIKKIKDSNAKCFASRMEFEKYKEIELRKYLNNKQSNVTKKLI